MEPEPLTAATDTALNGADKDELLQQRRAKLASWKLKRSKLKGDEPIEDDNKGKQQDRLAKWKEMKRKRDMEKLEKRNDNIPTTESANERIRKQNPKKFTTKANKRKKLSFDVDDDGDTIRNYPLNADLFKPNMQVAALDEPVDKSVSVTKTDEDADPFESLLNGLTNEPSKSNHNTNLGILESFEDDFALNTTVEINSTDDNQNRLKKINRVKNLRKVNTIKYNINDLEPFQKIFYFEPEDIKNISQEELDDLRLNLDNIKVKGNSCPVPILRWSQLGLPTSIMQLIQNKLHFVNMTPIQAQTIPTLMAGKDVIGISKTGSGKTIAYLLPLIRHIKAQRDLSESETGPIGLILAPTRELALQIYQEVKNFTDSDNSFTSICCTGGSEMKKQVDDLKRGCKLVVATPGRFIDLLTLNNGKLLNPRRITFVVLDEADRLFDMGFEPQVTQIMQTVRPDKQCALFSATFPNKLKKFAIKALSDPLTITINSKSMVSENVEQSFQIFDNDFERYDGLCKLIAQQLNKPSLQDEKIIIFVASQQICDTIFNKLDESGFETFAIHAGKTYQERIINLENFKRTPNGILLCTEVLSRGLNVPEVSLVIIYNAIKMFAQYVHTTGRTGRGTNHGKAITLLLSDEIAGAYIIQKAIREKDLAQHAPEDIVLLNEMSDKFEKGLQQGKFKLSKGFGGKGLENIDNAREEVKRKERKAFNVDENDTATLSGDLNSALDDNDNNEIVIPKLEYVTERQINDDGNYSFTTRVNINDLPKLVRWEATKNTTLSFIKEETGCSITTRGQYFPPGAEIPRGSEKLYLFIESNEEKDIRLLMDLLEEKMKSGLKKIEIQSLKNTKF